jgi:hypothetical protein
MKRFFSIIPLVTLLLWSAACATQKVPAENALEAAEAAWEPVRAEANRYVPDQAKGVEDALAAAKDAMAKGKYEAVIKGATALPTKIADVQKTLVQKKGEWLTAWKTMESALGSGLVAVQEKVDELAKARRLPAGVDKAAVEGAKTTLATAQQAFEEGSAYYRDGDYEGALARANQTKAELVKIITDLELDMPLLKEAGGSLMESAQGTIKGALEKK